MNKSKNLSLFLSNSSSTYYINTDLEGVFTYTNAFFLKIFGFDPKKILTQSLAEIIHPEDLDIYQDSVMECLAHPGKTVCSDLRIPRRDGSLFWVRWEFGALLDDQNHVAGIQALGNDMTERKRAELERNEAEYSLHLLLNNTNEGFLLVNTELDVVTFNHSAHLLFQRFYGVPLKRGLPLMMFEEKEQFDFVESLMQEALNGKQQERQIRKSIEGKDLIFSVNYKPVLKDDVVKGIILTYRNITKKVIAEEQLIANERYFRALIENSADAIVIIDKEEKVTDISSSAHHILGYELADLIGKTAKDIIHPADLARSKALFLDTLKEYDAIRTTELRVIDVHGNIKWVFVTLNNLLHEPSIAGVVINFNDITQRKNAESALLVSEEKYRFLFFANPQPMWIYDQSTYEFIEVNTAAVEHYGYSREEFFNMTILDIRPEEDIPELKKRLESVLQSSPGPSSAKRIWRHIRKSGEIIFVEIKSHAVDYNGRKAFLVSVNDLTNMVKAELELVRSNERFSYAVKATTEAIWEWDLLSGEYFIGKAFTNISGWPASAFSSFEDLHPYYHPDDRCEVLHTINTSLADGEVDSFTHEFRFRQDNGEYLYLADSAWIIRDDEGTAIKVVGSMKDISKTKQYEQELLLSKERFELAGKATSDAIWDADLRNDTIHWGEGFETLFGYQVEQDNQSSNTWIDHVHPDDRERVLRAHYTVVHNQPEEKFWQDEYRFIRADGTIAHVLDKGIIIRDEAGKAFRIIGAMQDITHRKEAEEKLQRERFLLRTMIDHLPDYINVKSRTGKLIISNEANVKLIGAESEQQILGKTVFEFLDPQTAERIADTDQRIMSSGVQEVNQEEIFITPQKDKRWLLTSRVPLKNESDQVIGIVGISRDITEKKAIEESLRKTLDQYAILSNATNDAIWDWNLHSGQVVWNKATTTLFGYTEIEEGTDSSWWVDNIHPQDRSRVEREIHRHIKRAIKNWQSEYRFRCADGKYKYVLDRGYLLLNENNEPYRMIGAMIDLTERKILEEELAAQKVNRQRHITEATIQAQEKERTEIGRELHDNINQILTTTKLYLDMAINEEAIREELLVKCHKNVSVSIEEIRKLSRSLVPPSLGDIGIKEALGEMVTDLNLTQSLKVRLRTSGLSKLNIPSNTKLMIYRIVQEQVNNILKHSGASEAEIRLSVSGNWLQLLISDNGSGFDMNKRKKGIGLNNITSRAELHNGHLEIQSSPGNGCILKVSIPV